MIEVEFSRYEVKQIISAINLSIDRINKEEDNLLGFKDAIIDDLKQILIKLNK